MAEKKMSREARNQYRRANTLRRKAEAQATAKERTAKRATRGPVEQMAILATRPGESKRERARLARMLGRS
jgi:hypothetical protein